MRKLPTLFASVEFVSANKRRPTNDRSLTLSNQISMQRQNSEMNQPRFARRITLLVAAACLLTCACGPKTGPGVIDPDAPTEFTTTESGLRYRILRQSNRTRPLPSDRVEVDYSGWLDDGTTFDSSYARAEPAEFSLGQVVKGWSEGMQLIGEGGMIELEVPPELGYGENGRPPKIPGNATLHFKVELLKVL